MIAPRRSFANAGFTLVELLVVIGIIAVLMGVLFPVIRSVRAQGQLTVCKSNLRQIYTALIVYGNDNRDAWPHGDLLGLYGYRVRPGLPTPGDPAAQPETYGLAAVLHGLVPKEDLSRGLPKAKYLDGRSKVWMCPSYRDDLTLYGNTYSFTAPTGLVSVGSNPPTAMVSYTSIKRAKAPTAAFVWDNITQRPGLSNKPGPYTTGYTLDAATRPYPHRYAKGTKNSAADYLYLDGQPST